MAVTIATHNRPQVSRQHNLRNKNVIDKEPHINPKGIHEVWLDENPQDAYERIFGDAVREYNLSQKRSDRKKANYYSEICMKAKEPIRKGQHDNRQKPVYEMIIGIYNKKDKIECDEKTGKKIMHKFVDNWKERNPNLELIGAYYHADEEGQPHVHIDYVPVAHGYTIGLKIRNGLVRAFEEMGFHKERENAQIQWERRENEVLEQICKEYGLQVEHPQQGKGITHLETEAYKKGKQLEREISAYILKKEEAIEELNYIEEQFIIKSQDNCIIQNKQEYEIRKLKMEIEKQKKLKELYVDSIENKEEYMKQYMEKFRFKDGKNLLEKFEEWNEQRIRKEYQAKQIEIDNDWR